MIGRNRRPLGCPLRLSAYRAGRVCGILDGRNERRAEDPRGVRNACDIEQGSRKITERYRPIDARPGGNLARESHDQRDVKQLDKEAVSVRQQVVLAELVPMIAGNDHEGPVKDAASRKVGQHTTNLMVHVGDSAVVAVSVPWIVGHKPGAILFRRPVRFVRKRRFAKVASLPSVIKGSAYLRNSFALGKVVLIIS